MWEVLSSWRKWSPESGYGVRREPRVKHSQHLRIYWGKNEEGILTSCASGGEYVAQMINRVRVWRECLFHSCYVTGCCVQHSSLWPTGSWPRQVLRPSGFHPWKEKFRVVLIVCQPFKRNTTASQIKALIWILCSILYFGWLFFTS